MIKLKELFSKNNSQSKRDYYFGKYKLLLSKHHVLDKYMKKYPLYDRFFPLLCSGFGGLIIDIGANIGDTSIAVFSQNDNAFIVGVEPDKLFFNECVHNVAINGLSERFLGINKFVTTQTGNFIVKKSESLSTGSIEKADADATTNSISFSELIDTIPAGKKNKFDVLKIDTDGFDWDILKSFSEYAETKSFVPKYIFFEMQTFLNNREKINDGREDIIQRYKESLEDLYQLGYTNFCLFDNFGTFVKKTTSINEIHEFNNYIKRSQISNLYSTIYFLDVLAFKTSSGDYVDTILNKLYS
jgi:FkbM family methyltransferase